MLLSERARRRLASPSGILEETKAISKHPNIADMVRFDIGNINPEIFTRYFHDLSLSLYHASEDGKNVYDGVSAGIESLRKGYSRYFAESGYKIPASSIFLSSGGMGGLSLVDDNILNPYDIVLTTDPRWETRESQQAPIISKTQITRLPLYEELGWQFKPKELEEMLVLGTKVFEWSSPLNPTGTKIKSEYFDEAVPIIHSYAKTHPDFRILEDWAYHRVNYSGEFTTFLDAPELADRVIIVNSLSKSFAMPGWREGMIAVVGESQQDFELHEALENNMRTSTTCLFTPAQHAVAEALNSDEIFQRQEEMILKEYLPRRNRMVEALERAEVSFVKPDGAIYVLANVKRYGTPSEVAKKLQDEYGITVVTGGHFGKRASNHVRINYMGPTDERFEVGLERLEKTFTELAKIEIPAA